MKSTYTYLESKSRTLEEAYGVIQLRLQGRRHCVYMYNIIARAICNKLAHTTFLMYFDIEVEVNERSGCHEDANDAEPAISRGREARPAQKRAQDVYFHLQFSILVP